MKELSLISMKSKIKINVKGKKIRNFLIKLYKLKINIYYTNIISNEEMSIIVNHSSYKKIYSNKGIYDIKIIRYYGEVYYYKKIKQFRPLLISIILGMVLLFILSKTIFSVEIIHESREIRKILINEMTEYGLKKYRFKKSFSKIEEIEQKILKKYRDKLEWLEITNIGTKYIVKVEERIIPMKDNLSGYQNIISKKNGVIKNVKAINGVPEVKYGDYVHKGDILINGTIKLNDSEKGYTRADGKVFAEVWYISKVDFPLNYIEKSYTGKRKKTLSFRFLKNMIGIFDFSPFKTKDETTRYWAHDLLLPIGIGISNERETTEINEFYTEESAILKATELSEEKIKMNLSEDEYIISKKTLYFSSNNSRIELVIFFTVYENIAEAKELEIINDKENN